MIAGCSGAKSPATAKVTGVVTYKGSPVEGATVIFAPSAGGKPATAITDAEGHYALSTFGAKDGAVPGDYKVTVTKTTTEGTAPELSYEKLNELSLRGEQPPGPVVKHVLPAKYASETTSGLDKTVKSGSNDFPLDLTD